MVTKTCIIEGCNEYCKPGRRYCRQHYLERTREQARARYAINGRYKYHKVCLWCNKPYLGDSKTSSFCSMLCYFLARNAMKEKGICHTSVSSGKEAWLHRYFAIKAIGERVLQGYNLHHLDLDLDNNTLSNLALLTRSQHSSLHSYLTHEAIIRVPYGTPSRIDKMRELIPTLTEEWFDKTNTKLITVQQLADEHKEQLLV